MLSLRPLLAWAVKTVKVRRKRMKLVIRNSRWSGSKNVEVNNELEINLTLSNHICFCMY